MKYFIFLSVIIWASFTFGCKTILPVTIVTPEVKEFEYVAQWSNPEYTKILLEALEKYGQPMLNNAPKNFAEYCKKPFANLTMAERKQFYLTLFSSLAFYESSFKPNTTFRENFKDQKGNYVISAGLMQLSVESGNAYGCGLKSTNDLLDPKTNLECAVRIANRWVGERDFMLHSKTSPWLGFSRYWSPYRNSEKVAAMKAKTMNLAFCK